MERLGLRRKLNIQREIKRYLQEKKNQNVDLKEYQKEYFEGHPKGYQEEYQKEYPEEYSKGYREKYPKGYQEEYSKGYREGYPKEYQKRYQSRSLRESLEKTETELKKKQKKGKKEFIDLEKEKGKIERFYVSKQRKKDRRHRKIFILFVCIVILLFFFQLFTKIIEPSIIAMCEIRANSIGVSVSNKAIKQVMEEVGYDRQLVHLEKDEAGNIIALKADVIEMNYIASLIGSRTQQMYNELTEAYVKIPIGNFTGNALLAGRGPSIEVKIVPVGTVGSDFKTEFVSTGINQTRHRVYLEVVSSMRVIAPFSTKTIKVVNNVNVAETVLIGDVPSSYYNLEGRENIEDDSLNLWQD